MNKVKSMDDYIRDVLSFARQFEYAQQKHTSEFMYELADYLKSLPVFEEQPKVEWIPVSERLPEEGQRVHVTYLGYYDKKPRSDNCAYFHGGGWSWDLDDSEVAVEIIAWMPLLEPY